jgi:hypothetical protein
LNLFGIDVSGLEPTSFLAGGRALYVALALGFLLLLPRLARPLWLLLGVCAANAWAWALTNYPLVRPYAVGVSHDRLGNLAMCQSVAVGGPAWETMQVGQLHMEPFWGVVVAALAGFDPDRVLAIYPYFALVMPVAFAITLYVGLGSSTAGVGFDRWERALAAAFGTLLCSAPTDFVGTYDVPWAMTFLLKPNHALALVLFPLLLRQLSTIRGWPGRLAGGLLLHLIGWAFVLHMVYVSFGLLVFVLIAWLRRAPEARRDLLDVSVVLGINVLVVSPYLVMLLVGYPFLRPSPQMTIPVFSPHLLEPMLRSGFVFVLAVYGLFVVWKRPDRLSRLWFAQVVGAHLLWVLYLGLGWAQLARERDELFYWLRFMNAATAAVGAWDLAGRVLTRLSARPFAPALRATAVLVLALPFSLPYWWDPLRMDRYFKGCLQPLPARVERPTEFLRHHTRPTAVVAGDRDYARYVGALGARRLLLSNAVHAPKDFERRVELERSLLRGREGYPPDADRYGVTYLVVTPHLLESYPDVSLADLQTRPYLREVHLTARSDTDYVAIFELVRGEARRP